MTIRPPSKSRALILGLVALALLAGMSIPIADSLAENEQTVRATPLGSAFIFQGRVDENGLPANGAYDFEFRLLDQAVGGLPIAGPVPAEDVQVTNGLFTLPLDFGTTAFDGNERFLEVQVRPGAGGTFALLGERQPLTATPYALYARETGPHSHFGETWSGPLSPLESGLTVEVTGSSGDSAITGSGTGVSGLRGESTNDAGVYGFSDVFAGVYGRGSTGVIGISTRPLGPTNFAGVTGINGSTDCSASSTALFCAGVAGIALSDPDTIGVYGKGVRWGVYSDGALGAANPGGIAVFGIGATGVSGQATGVGNAGVAGIAHTSASCNNIGGTATLCYGVIGDASATPGQGGIGLMGIGSDAGIWGRATGPSSYAAIFDGRVHFNGILDAPSGQIRTVSLKPDFDGLHNLGFNGVAYGNVVTYNLDEISDIRRKKDIEHIAYGLDAVLALNPVSYRLRNRDSGIELGLIAQEVREVIPEVVDEGDDPDHTLAMDYTDLIPVLVRAIQEQDLRIDVLANGGGQANTVIAEPTTDRGATWVTVAAIAFAFLGVGFGLGQMRPRGSHR